MVTKNTARKAKRSKNSAARKKTQIKTSVTASVEENGSASEQQRQAIKIELTECDGNSESDSNKGRDSDKKSDPSHINVNDNDSVSTEEGNDNGLHPSAPPPVEQKSAYKFKSDGRYHNKQRCLILSSRGITSRQRHLLEDLRTLLPHQKKEGKLDASKSDPGGIGRAVNDIAEMRGCTAILFLECRKRRDAYLWLGCGGGAGVGVAGGNNNSASIITNVVSPVTEGPSAKFLVENVHTMDELRLTGNCMKGSRPVLTFDSSFDQMDELKLLKCLFTNVFSTPRGHPKSKPFVDRIMGFYYVDGKIWVRNYQIIEQHAANARDAHLEKKRHGESCSTSLVEIGPRFVLNPIRIFRGSFGGQTLYQNTEYTNPNVLRSAAIRQKGGLYRERKEAQQKRKDRQEAMVLPEDPLASVFS